MKIKHLMIGMLAIAASVACDQVEPVEEPVLEVNKTEVAVAATAAEGAFEVTANNAWTATADADWVSLTPAAGDGAEKAVKVKVTADDNTATEARTATVTVKSGALTKTVKVTQAAAEAGEEPGPDDPVDAATYILVGEAVGGWDVDNNGVVLTLKDGYYEAKGVAVTAKKGMHFTKNNKWEGNVKGLHGLIAPNEIGEVGNNDISLTEGGNYDVYLTEALDKFYFMTEGKLPSEAVEHVDIAVSWGICGALEGNVWGAATDVEFAADGEWLAAKGVVFTEVNFKVRGNNSWADDVKWGTATKNQTCELNKAIAVSTCTEFKAANPSENDNPNIYIAAGAGTYDVYFSPDKKEVWVMTPGYKPGDETPEAPVEPVTEGVIWENDGTVGAAAWSGSPYRFAKEGMDGLNECCAQIPAAVWEGMKIASFSVNVKPAPAATWWQIRVLNGWWGEQWPQANPTADGGEYDIKPTTEGVVDNGDGTYTFTVEFGEHSIVPTLDEKHLLFAGDGFIINKIYFGEAETPGEPELELSDWNIVGSFTGAGWGWDPTAGLALSVLDENYFVYYGLELTADAQWKFLQGTAWGGAEVGADRTSVEPNTIQAKGGSNIYVTTPGKYDIYLAADASKYYVMSEGKTPAEATEPAPVEVTYTVTGTIQDNNWNNMAAVGLMAQEGAYYVAKNVPFVTAADLYGGADQIEFKVCNTGSWDGAYGLTADAAYSLNAEIAVVSGGEKNIAIAAPSGAYDVYFDKDNAKVWVMEPGLKPGETPAAPVDVDIDGKQWVFTWQALNAPFVIDLGVTEPGVAILAYDMAALDPEYAGIYYPYMIGTYEITKTDGTSGVVTFTDIDYGETINIPYSNATENSVHFESEALLEENVDCTLATSKIEISMESTEYLPDGEYWIIADGKVATPLTSNYGYLQVTDAIDGKSYAANAFTFTQVEEGLYTIQDASGKYYYQTGTYNSFNVSATDGGTDEYLWEVYDTGNGQYAIINYDKGKYIQLDSQYGTYGSYSEEKGTMPALVLAEDPIAEPEPEQPGEGETGEYATTVVCNTVSSAYVDGVATVNGVADVFTLKLGTSKLNGTATVTLPAGATEVSFYAVGWKNTSVTLQFSVGGEVVATQAIAANVGATGNSPYTMTVTDSDKYTLSLGEALAADTEVTVETTGSAYRAILFGIQAK